MDQLDVIIDRTMLKSQGVAHTRKPQDVSALALPPGTTVVSADNHLTIKEDIWFQRFPDRLKDRAPRVWSADGIWHLGFNGKSVIPEAVHPSFAEFDQLPGSADMAARTADLRAEGIVKEVVFANALHALLHHPDFEIREWTFRIYNEYMAELQAAWPGFYAVAYIDYWRPDNARESLAEIKRLGLKSYFLPINPGKHADGHELNYTTSEMDRFWDAAEEAELPISYHIGETFSHKVPGARGMFGTTSMQNFSPFRRTIGELLFGGILDRHPSLRILFAEGGINWLATAIQDAELIAGARSTSMDWQLREDPRHYWEQNLYATFMVDRIGLAIIDEMPKGHALWASDYPHPESTYGYSGTAMQQVLKATDPDNARIILGDAAIDFFGL